MAKHLFAVDCWRGRLPLSLWLLLPLFACSCAHVSESRVNALQPAIAVASYAPSGPDDFGFIDRFARGKRILFLGEAPHEESMICEVVLGLSLHLRKECGYTVLAREFVYSAWPYLEAQSLGHEGKLPNVLPESERVGDYNVSMLGLGPVVAYNRSVPEEKRLLCTAIDCDHCIGRSKPFTALYLGYLASKSNSSEARAALAKAIPALVPLKLKQRKEVHACLNGLDSLFRAYWNTHPSKNKFGPGRSESGLVTPSEANTTRERLSAH